MKIRHSFTKLKDIRPIELRRSPPEYPQISDHCNRGQYLRLGTVSLETGWACLKLAHTKGIREHFLCGTIVNFSGNRLGTYYHKGTNCIACGCVGWYWAIERITPYSGFHISLYSRGHHLITSDHIVAVSKGGRDNLANRQPLCHKCNNKKGSADNTTFIASRKKLRASRENHETTV